MTITFGIAEFKITEPEPGWFQRGTNTLPECRKCGDTLTFTFSPRTDPQMAGLAGSYSTPTGIRCRCFVIDSRSSTEMNFDKNRCGIRSQSFQSQSQLYVLVLNNYPLLLLFLPGRVNSMCVALVKDLPKKGFEESLGFPNIAPNFEHQ